MKQVVVSERLNTVISFVEPGNRFADVGTDHGFVPICLVQRGVCPGGLAMDVREGPLERARRHIREYGLEKQIETRLGDGFSAMRPGEADTGILAGLGGPLMIRILEAGREQVKSLRELILSPQSEIEEVRAYIRERNFRIVREAMLCEDGKYYTVMKVSLTECAPEPEPGFSRAEDRYGALLLRMRDPVLKEFLEREEEKRTDILRRLSAQPGKEMRSQERVAELSDQIRQIREIREHYYEVQ